MTVRRVLVLGATSGIAQAVVRCFAADGASLALVARNPERLAAVAADAGLRGASSVHTVVADLADLARIAGVLDGALEALGGLDVALVAHGEMPSQAEALGDPGVAERVWRTNFISAATLLEQLARRSRPGSSLGVLSSVAGDRGRADNYVYGASKAALSAYASGLAQRVAQSGVRIVLIKPGPVDTPMTAHFSPRWLLADVDVVGRRIHRALLRRERVVYVPAVWRPVMAVVRALPSALFERLNR